MMEKEELYSFALSIATSSSLLMILKAIIELDIIGIINRAGPGAHLSPAQIAAQLPTKDPDATASMLDRMLRVLANNSILSCSLRALPNDGPIERLYGLAPVCQFFTKPEDFGPLVLLLQDKVYTDTWHHLKDAVLDGDNAFKKAHGVTVFEYLGIDMRFSKVFNDAMSNCSRITMKNMLENYNGFDGLSTLVDVGGGTGQTLNMIIAKHPTIRGINFDLPHVIKDAPKYDGVEHITGDMFVSVPAGDAIFMKGWARRALLSPGHIAAQLPIKNLGATASMLDHMLRVLANNSVLSYSLEALPGDRPIERLHRLAPSCQFTNSSLGLKILVLWFNFVCYTDTWHHLKDALLDGDNAFKKAHGTTLFEYLGTDIWFSKVFNDVMSNYSTITMKKMLENYDGFDGLSTLVDVGGGTAKTLNMIITKYPTTRGVNFHLAHVIKDAPKYDNIK